MKRVLLILLLSTVAYGQGSSVFPYTTPLWRTFLDGTTAEFQADSDSTTFFQVLDADGGVPVLNVDTTNERVGVRRIASVAAMEVEGQLGLVTSGATIAAETENGVIWNNATSQWFLYQPAASSDLRLDVAGTDTFTFLADGNFRVPVSGGLEFGSTSDTLRVNDTFKQMGFATDASTAGGGQLILGAWSIQARDYDHAPPTNPTLFIHSVTDPDSANDEWVSIEHDQTNAVLTTGKGVVSIPGVGDGGRTNYDLKIGDTSTPDYGMIQFGDAVVGRTSYKAGNIDLDGSILFQNIGGPVTSQVEFCFAVSTGASTRFALAKAGVGNATYNSRSMLIAGPAPADTNFVTVGYWQTNNSIFDNLTCDTSGTGADLGVQNDLEVEGDIFTDSIKESTTASGVTFANNIHLTNFAEVRFYDDGSNYVGFEAPALTADQIWVLPTADGDPGAVLTTDGFGTLDFEDNASEKSWSFMSRDASSGTNYVGGYYKFETSDNDFNPSVTFGTANASYAAHFFLVQAAGASGGTDTVIRVTGTTIDDAGNRATAVDVDITVDDAAAAGTYYETTEKWLGQVTIAKQSGPDLLCNYGYCKYWDNNNTQFKIAGIEATWLGAKNDNTPDIKIRHHKETGWTYNNAAAPTPPPPVASMAADHNTEIYIRAAEEGAWKRDDLADNVDGTTNEGILIELVTTTNRTYAIGNFMLRITPFGDIRMIYENSDIMIYENGDIMIYN